MGDIHKFKNDRLDDLENIKKQVQDFQHLDKTSASVEEKLDELINLLQVSNLDSESLKKIRQKLSCNLEVLLSQQQLDSKVSKNILLHKRVQRISFLLVSLISITLGFAIIIMPAPPSFGMFTLFYFNPNDGVTLIDLIALLIIFTGVYLFVTSVIKMNRVE